jgi:hypothetical protein
VTHSHPRNTICACLGQRVEDWGRLGPQQLSDGGFPHVGLGKNTMHIPAARWLSLAAADESTRAALTHVHRKVAMRLIAAVLLGIWLVIGVAAAGQRHYFSSSSTSCAKASSTAVTIVAGPLNYVGANPKIKCSTPQPSS